jgi:hypothetical protein
MERQTKPVKLLPPEYFDEIHNNKWLSPEAKEELIASIQEKRTIEDVLKIEIENNDFLSPQAKLHLILYIENYRDNPGVRAGDLRDAYEELFNVDIDINTIRRKLNRIRKDEERKRQQRREPREEKKED